MNWYLLVVLAWFFISVVHGCIRAAYEQGKEDAQEPPVHIISMQGATGLILKPDPYDCRSKNVLDKLLKDIPVREKPVHPNPLLDLWF